jgi:hypothetical protein
MTEKQKIEGKWVWRMYDHTVTYHFYSDGSYSYNNTYSGVMTYGRYRVEGNVVTFILTNSVASSEFYLSGNELTLTPITPKRGNTLIFKQS